MTKSRAFTYVAIGVLGVSFSPIITKSAESSALSIAMYRLIFACLILLLLNYKRIDTLLHLPAKERSWSMVSGVFLALHFYFWIASLKLTSVASATVLVNVHPIAILIIGVLLYKEKPKPYQLFAVTLTLVGSYVLAQSDLTLSRDVIIGDIYAVISAMLFAFYLTLGKLSRQTITTFQYTMFVYGTCALTLILMSILTGGGAFVITHTSDWWVFIGLAVIPTLFGHSMFNKALEAVSTSFISLAVLGEPILASIWAFLIFRESVTAIQVVGMAVVLIGIAIYYLPEMRSQTYET
ncbi:MULTISPECIES: DMT family transporter [unclassified Fusibacter]|uniref:DMT family transporter n=1 Tax=unclassified Fusibacter TaxID=2624464 RepID=UPI0010110088|nr:MULTISPECIES: DMT family transporter [unclassified Fusibacter]MCK8058841.1 DMT family transporter [Fusibacter sp. A2]NPE21915.1 DMT family transporter [Fusibacter sp. A1]RXV61485.1 DMT family transporter [Fusibacter sp. A1]